MKITTACAVTLLCCAGTSQDAFAFCSEPSFSESEPTSPGSWARPDVPYCLSEFAWSGEHSCDSWEIDAYQREVREYVTSLANYADEARRFAEEAISFSNEVGSYANCEIDSVSTQHE
jgi:hypothetical protein